MPLHFLLIIITNHSPPTNPILLLLRLIAVVVLVVHGSPVSASVPFATTCPSSFCPGRTDVLISYPFYEINVSSSSSSSAYCGYPGFGISCSGPTPFPEIHLPDGDYLVRNINYTNNTFTLIDAAFITDPSQSPSCPRARHALQISQTTPLTIPNSNSNLTFYFNCSHVPSSIPHIDCLGMFQGNKSYVFGSGSEPEVYDWVSGCVENVTVETAEAEVDWGNATEAVAEYPAAMRRGFVLEWGPMKACGTCEESGGRCGYRKTASGVAEGFFCYCKDGGTAIEKCKTKGK